MASEYLKIIKVSGHDFGLNAAFILKALFYLAVGVVLFWIGYKLKGEAGGIVILLMGVLFILYINDLLWF